MCPGWQTNKSNSNLIKSNQIYPDQIKSNDRQFYPNQIKSRGSDLFGYLVIWIDSTHPMHRSNHRPESPSRSQPTRIQGAKSLPHAMTRK
jgi:hypothetical protein